MLKKICDTIAKEIGILVLLTAVLAYVFPEAGREVPTLTINPLLGVIMFGMGLTLRAEDLRIVFARPKGVLIGCGAQFMVMPTLAWGLCKILNLPTDIAIGVILVGCCPGGTASNVITYLAGGDLALSVGMTAVSTLLAPILTPLLTWLLAGAYVGVDAWGMLKSILMIVVAPIACGLLVQRYLPKLTRAASVYLPALSSMVIAVVVWIIVSHNAETLRMAGALVVLSVILHNVCGLLLGYGVAHAAKLSKKERIAMSVEVGMQNSGLASSLSVSHFAMYPMAAVPGAVFSVWHNISGAIVARIMHKK
mgnify:CR=1 FL=1